MKGTVLDLLRGRCSVRDFTDESIPDDVVRYILEAGRLSPSGGNEQPWKFVLVRDRESIERMAEIAYGQKWIRDAAMLVVLCVRDVDDRGIQKARFPELDIESMDYQLYFRINMEEHQTKIPGTHMVLAAWEKGVGSTWISYFRVDELAEFLGLPSGYLPSEMIAFGYPKGDTEPVEKKDMDDVLIKF